MEEKNPSPQSPKERHQLRDGGRSQQEDGTRCISTLPRKLPPSHTSSRPQLQQPRGSQGRSLHWLTSPRSSQGTQGWSLTRLTSPRSSQGTQGRSLTRLTSPRSSQGSQGWSLTRLTSPCSSQGSQARSRSRPRLTSPCSPQGSQARSRPRLTSPCSSQGSQAWSVSRLTSPCSSQGSQAWSVSRLTSSLSTLSSAGTESRLSPDAGGPEQGPQGRKCRPGGSLQPSIQASRATARGQLRLVRSRWARSGVVGPEAASTRKPIPVPRRKASHRVDQEAQTETWAQEVDSAVQYAEQETQTDTVAEEETNSAAPLMVDQETETEALIQKKSSASSQITDEWTQTKAHSSAPSTGTVALAHQQPPSLSCRAFWRSCTTGQPHAASALQDLKDSHCSRQPLQPERSTPEKWGWTALLPYSWPWLIEMNRF
ncbi:dendrin-like [Molothrus ater]|uniref:dendrin-like n=1 Tax=Molothrus ater TaxID=84834 RepID=UPI00174B7A34|nr:dendrin-like [Molothrus ater]